MIKVKTPIRLEDILKWKVGDKILISGTIFAARDKAHQFLLKNNFSKMKNAVIYHCGPLIRGKKVFAAGPTTSSRMNLYTPEIIKKYGIRIIIGKGGMDPTVRKTLKGKGVYLATVGGASVLYADKLKVKNVYKKEFGMTDAIWEFEAKDFPAIVTIDSNGNSLHEDVYEKSKKIFLKFIHQNEKTHNNSDR